MQSASLPPSSDKCQFPLVRTLSGVVAGQQLSCRLNDSICSLCSRFLNDFLSSQTWPDNSNDKLWEKRVFARRSWPDETAFRWVFHRYRCLKELRDSATSGCALCKEALRISDAGQAGPVVFTSAEALITPEGTREYQESAWGIEFQIHSLDVLDKSLKLADQGRRYNVVVVEDAFMPLAPPGQPASRALLYPSKSSDSDKCFRWISEWCSRCINSHQKCRRPDLPLPSRLLDVCPSYTSQNWIALCESKDLGSSVTDRRYLALSYCWGKSQNYKTTKTNMADHMQGLRVQDLPRVIQDAVSVTRRYGLKYLWVDALCIIQDDSADWEFEAARMGDVYAGSVFTISALSSAGCDEPILGPRDLAGIPVGNVFGTGSSEQQSLQLWVRTALETLPNAFNGQPLSDRAWCYQERLLAPGIVHFGHNQLIWECNTSHLEAETGLTFGYSRIYRTMSRLTDIGSRTSEEDLWDALVVNFTQLNITYASDRVAAMSGLAAYLRKTGKIRGRYVAGLWEDDLLYQLLWSVQHWEEKRRIGDVDMCSVFPTWTWATTNRATNPPGWRGSARSALEGRPRFRLIGSAEQSHSLGVGRTLDSCEVMLEGYVQDVNPILTHHNGVAVDLTRTCPDVRGGFWSWDCQPFATPCQLHCVRMVHRTPDESAAIVYLVLIKDPTYTLRLPHDDLDLLDYQVYRRVGLLTIEGLSVEHFQFPWPDVLSNDGSLILSRGRWEDVVLI